MTSSLRYGFTLALTTALVSACGGGGGGGEPAPATVNLGNPVSSQNPDNTASNPAGLAANSCTSATLSARSNNSVNTVSIDGVVTYDYIPPNEFNGLDYGNIEARPARGIVVQAVTNSGAIDSTVTDENGFYTFDVPRNAAVTVRARAELKNTGNARWDVRVEDNTSNGAIYVLDANITDTRSQNISCDLHAASGWSNSAQRYANTRASGPFAIADTVYTAIKATVAVDANVQMPPLVVNWSTRNTPAGNCSGGMSAGCIGTSFYSEGELFILGAEGIDTDEHDAHVVTHEWGHYFEHNLSRSDSIGGQHSGSATLDIRVAMAEGFANAAAATFRHDPIYRDSSGSRQQQGFEIDVEENEDRGWFNEDSVQSLIYDIIDADQDSSDTLNEGWGIIYDALTSDSYKNTPAATSIFALLQQLQSDDVEFNRQLAAMAASRGINSSNEFAFGESNNRGDSSDVLPLVTEIVEGETRTVCAIDRFGTTNRLSNYRFLRFNNRTAGAFEFSAVPAGESPAEDPDLRVSQAGEELVRFDATGPENGSIQLAAGDYLIEASEYCFANPGVNNCRNTRANGRSCIDITVSRR